MLNSKFVTRLKLAQVVFNGGLDCSQAARAFSTPTRHVSQSDTYRSIHGLGKYTKFNFRPGVVALSTKHADAVANLNGTVVEVAAATGLSPSTVSRCQNGTYSSQY